MLDPEAIEDAIGAGAYAALDSALTMAPAAICDLVEAAGLGGRGGAAFPAGRKWKFLLGAPGPVKYLLCNADEGDPGAFVNRILMESDPHSLIEGMLIAARATEASHGVIYIRDEYPLSVARVETALAQARAAGLLGEDILGSGWNFDLAVARGAGSYVCGEETGLIASLAGVRGMPTIRPPFPAQRGLFGRPSNVNNVETYANVPPILRHGAEWYRQHGTASDPGTKLFSISGHLQRPGVLEVAFGLPLSTLLLDAGGGCGPGHTPKGVQPGGPLSGLLPAADLDLPLERPPFTERSLLLGSGGLILFDERTCALDLALYLSEFCEGRVVRALYHLPRRQPAAGGDPGAHRAGGRRGGRPRADRGARIAPCRTPTAYTASSPPTRRGSLVRFFGRRAARARARAALPRAGLPRPDPPPRDRAGRPRPPRGGGDLPDRRDRDGGGGPLPHRRRPLHPVRRLPGGRSRRGGGGGALRRRDPGRRCLAGPSRRGPAPASPHARPIMSHGCSNLALRLAILALAGSAMLHGNV